MTNTRPISEYSRQELYDLIWSTPASKLARDFGISDVAIAKRCKRRCVPRPSRGYWAKVEAGQPPEKTPLPPTLDEAFKQAAQRPLGKTVPLPENAEALHPLAVELMTAITKAKLDHYKRAHINDPRFPEVTVSKHLAERVAKIFHGVITELEGPGIRFRKFQGFHSTGYFVRSRDRLYMIITEDIVKADGKRYPVPSYQSQQQNEKASGYLTFSFNPDLYGVREVKDWSETPKSTPEATAAQLITIIRKHFVEVQEKRAREAAETAKQHAEWLKRTEEWERKEAIRLEQEKQLNHIRALADTALARQSTLLKAAGNWRLSQSLLEFIDVCEAQWKNQSPLLTAGQTSWLTWAREIAAETSPFSVGYPDPANDGTFEPELIPLGGPYPPTRKLR